MPYLFHGLGKTAFTKVTLDDDDLDNDSMFQDSEESLLSFSATEVIADPPPGPQFQFKISAERSTLYNPYSVFTLYSVPQEPQNGDPSVDSSEFPTSEDSMKSSSSSTMDLVVSYEARDHGRRKRIRITAMRFYERLKHFHLNRNYQSVAFDGLVDTEIDEIFAETNSPSPDYNTRDEMISPNVNLDTRFEFTMGEAPDDFSVLSVGGHLQRAIPIRRDNSEKVIHNLHLTNSFKYFRSLLRRSASLRDPPPTFGDVIPPSHVYQDWSDNENLSSQQADMGSNMTPVDLTQRTPTSSTYNHGDSDVIVLLKNPLGSGNEMLMSRSEENSSLGNLSCSDKSRSYISPVSYMIDDLLMTSDMVSSACYFSER